MGARNTPSPPSSDKCAADPIKKTTTECPKCWTDDFEKNISVNSYGRYFKKYKTDGTEYSYNFPKKYKILAPVKTGNKITVEVRFKDEAQIGVSAADATAGKTKLENGVNTHWNSKFTLEADDPECGKKSFSVEYKIVLVNY